MNDALRVILEIGTIPVSMQWSSSPPGPRSIGAAISSPGDASPIVLGACSGRNCFW